MRTNRIAGAAAAAVVGLPVEARRELGKWQAEFARGIRRLVKAFSDEQSAGKTDIDWQQNLSHPKVRGSVRSSRVKRASIR